MDASSYYKHTRTLGAFPASECLALAREAARLDFVEAKFGCKQN